MRKHSKQANPKKDIYQEVTNYVIAELEKGNIIWQQGWTSQGLPKNFVSGHRYRGWNLFLLNFLTVQKGYSSPNFITFKQAQDLGGTIRKGEKGTPIVYWATIENKYKTITSTDEEGNEQTKHPMFRVPKQFIVFNLDQTEGIKLPPVQESQLNEEQRIAICEQLISNMPQRPEIRHRGDQAYYSPVTDTVTMPLFGLFHTETAYYTTLFHELAHSTGHSKRLNRKELTDASRFGSDTYGREELTAELTAAFLCAACGMEQQTIINSAAYIGGWLSAIRGDKTLILKAASQAQAAADFIRNENKKEMTSQSAIEHAA